MPSLGVRSLWLEEFKHMPYHTWVPILTNYSLISQMKKYTWTALLFWMVTEANGTCMKNLKVQVISLMYITREPNENSVHTWPLCPVLQQNTMGVGSLLCNPGFEVITSNTQDNFETSNWTRFYASIAKIEVKMPPVQWWSQTMITKVA